MLEQKYADTLGPALTKALADKGYETLTAVQQAVLDPALAGRDLRITSQTGSGKTLAIGFAVRALVAEECKGNAGVAYPRALIVAPTRELAQQVETELRWFYAKQPGKIASVTGGASVRDERRALGQGAAVVVGTPGRVLDHLRRGAMDARDLGTVVLDEADRMLDLGFREDLEAILAFAKKPRRTHLVSATFPRQVRALADSVQSNPAHVEGTRLGVANSDIDHVVHLVDPRQKLDAIINLLLRYPEDQTLVFARTRIEVGEIASELVKAGFAASSLSGEMDQAARNRALAAFKRGTLNVLVATDVAARGIDVQDITRVIHVELPTNADSYTHRSGRTGRAGRKGTSALLVSPAAIVHATRLLRTANVGHRFEAIPTPEEIRNAANERIVSELTAESSDESMAAEARMASLAERLIAAGDLPRTIARLLARTPFAKSTDAREVRAVSAPNARSRPRNERDAELRGERAQPREGMRDFGRGAARDERRGPPERDDRRDSGPAQRSGGTQQGFVPFRVSWGEEHGADARRLLAVVCRRGDIRGKDVGAIRVERNFAIVDVAENVAAGFESAAGEPDPRDPRILITRDAGGSSAGATRDRGPSRAAAPNRDQGPAERRPFPKKPFRKGGSAPFKARNP